MWTLTCCTHKRPTRKNKKGTNKEQYRVHDEAASCVHSYSHLLCYCNGYLRTGTAMSQECLRGGPHAPKTLVAGVVGCSRPRARNYPPTQRGFWKQGNDELVLSQGTTCDMLGFAIQYGYASLLVWLSLFNWTHSNRSRLKEDPTSQACTSRLSRSSHTQKGAPKTLAPFSVLGMMGA